jgi:uncharacterized SAM-binding protein YcdF (DUF218 family)
MSSRRVVLAAACLLSLISVVATALVIDVRGTRREALDWSSPTAIVVLGARVEADGRASQTLHARVMHAVALWTTSRRSPLLISGGVGTFGAAEADVGAALAMDAGVPVDQLMRERESHSTRENAQRSAALLREAGIDRVVLVSDPYHLARARLEFERCGLQVQTSPVLEAPRHQSPVERAFWTLREVPALLLSASRPTPAS